MATERQQAHALITYFQKKYVNRFGVNPPRFNRHALSHGFLAFVQDYPFEPEKIIDYYFDTYDDPDPAKFIYRYGALVEEMHEAEADAQEREEIRKKTLERMRIVTNSSEGDQVGNS